MRAVGQRPAKWSVWGWCLVAFVVLSALSRLVPPMQSPDETSHLMRAAMLANGQWGLQPAPADTPPELRGLGGDVDKHLALFGHDFLAIASQQNRQSPAELQRHHADLGWAGSTVFYPVPGTGYYFPLIYAPQALALKLGQAVGWGIAPSYQLARSLTLLVVCIVTALAWRRVPPNPAVVALVALPMGLFQAVSPTLDGLTTALALLAISEFLHHVASPARQGDAPRTPWLLWGCLFLVATSRTHLVPMLLLPLYLAWRQGSARAWAGWVVLVAACGAWVLHAMANTTDVRVVRAHSTAEILYNYLAHPWDFLRLVGQTLVHDNNLVFYGQSFVGILGWLDTPLPALYYPLIGAALGAAVLASVGRKGAGLGPRACLAMASGGAVMMVFLALAATWTPYPAMAIEGVQGRYFLVPALLLGYSLGGPSAAVRWRAAVAAVAVALSLCALIVTLHGRYHLVF